MPGITSTDNTYYEDPEPYYKTQYRILTGRDLSRRVIKQLSLENVPEYNGTAVAPAGVPFLDATSSSVSRRCCAGGRPPKPRRPRSTKRRTNRLWSARFIGHVDVIPVTGSRLVDITFTALDPTFAALAVNTLVDEYVDAEPRRQASGHAEHDRLARAGGEQAAGQGPGERARPRRLPRPAERPVARRQAEHRPLPAQQAERRRDELEDEEGAEGSPLQSDQGRSPPASRPRPFPPSRSPARSRSPRRGSSTRSGRVPRSPRGTGRNIRIWSKRAATFRKRSVSTRSKSAAPFSRSRTSTTRAVLEEQTMTRALDAAKADAQDLSKKSVNYNVMEREANSNRQVYESLLQRANELRVSSNSRSNNVRVIDHAEVPKGPMTPTGRRTWLLSLGVGLVLAVGRGLRPRLHERHDQDARGRDAPPEAAVPRPRAVGPRRQAPDARLVARAARLRRSVPGAADVAHLASTRVKAPRSMLVTSAQPLEGKTTTAANIAMALAYGGFARAADRRRHAPARPASPAAAHQRARSVAGADRPGARARRHPAHGRSEPAGDHRRQDAAEPVRAAGVGTHEDAADEPVARAVRLDRHRHAAGARRHRRRHPGAGRVGRDHSSSARR